MMTKPDISSADGREAAHRDDGGTVLPFRPRTTASQLNTTASPSPDNDDSDDFRHRMIVNSVGLLFAAILVASGIWLASSMANLRNTQDCVLSGRRNCAPIAAVDKTATGLGQH